jgi:hypothetical protein
MVSQEIWRFFHPTSFERWQNSLPQAGFVTVCTFSDRTDDINLVGLVELEILPRKILKNKLSWEESHSVPALQRLNRLVLSSPILPTASCSDFTYIGQFF